MVQKFKSLVHREVNLKSITKFHMDRNTRKRVIKNMVKCRTYKANTLVFFRRKSRDVVHLSKERCPGRIKGGRRMLGNLGNQRICFSIIQKGTESVGLTGDLKGIYFQ